MSTNQYLFRLHNLAVGLGWLPWRILPPAEWPQHRAKPRRGITAEEHARIINAEGNQERRSFYQLLWEIGASQTDAANLTAQNIKWKEGVLVYNRLKTNSAACVRIGDNLAALLRSLPKDGPLFPRIIKSTPTARSAEFFRRCGLGERGGKLLQRYGVLKATLEATKKG